MHLALSGLKFPAYSVTFTFAPSERYEIFSLPHQLVVKYQRRMGCLALDVSQSKGKVVMNLKPWEKQKITSIYFSKVIAIHIY